MPVGIFGMILVIVVVLIYGVIALSDFFGDSPAKGLGFLVGASLIVLIFIVGFPKLMDPSREVVRYEVIDVSLGDSSYVVSYHDGEGKVKVARAVQVIETDEPSYLAFCELKKGFLKKYGYVYFKSTSDSNQ